MTKDTGGPAFPQYSGRSDSGGMTLRDHYAGQAMAAIISGCLASDNSDLIKRVADGDFIAKAAGEMADAMIKERGK